MSEKPKESDVREGFFEGETMFLRHVIEEQSKLLGQLKTELELLKQKQESQPE